MAPLPEPLDLPAEPKQTPYERRGFALISAVFALVVVGAILVGGYTAATTETRVSDSERFAGLALYAAERGLAEAMGTVQTGALRRIEVDSTATVLSDTISGGGAEESYQVQVRRLDDDLFAFVSTGRLHRGSRAAATRQVGVITRSSRLNGQFEQALLLYGGLQLGGRVTVDGTDQQPGGWTGCDTLHTDKPAILAKDSSRVDQVGNSVTINGDPPIAEDTTISTSDFTEFGDLTFDELAQAARDIGTHVYPLGGTITGIDTVLTASGGCDTSAQSNWGDPLNGNGVCHYFFPLILSETSLTISGNSVGQGILLVNGDLHIVGGFQFYGIVIVRGELVIPGSGSGQIIGSTLVESGGELSSLSYLGGTPIIQYSSCSIERAQTFSNFLGFAKVITGRSWFDTSAFDY